MAQILSSTSPPPCHYLRRPLYSSVDAISGDHLPRWTALQWHLKCHGRFSLLFSDGRKQDQARKALENALGEKKSEYDKWNKEIEKREERGRKGGGGGGSGRGGGWFGWFGENFWEESQQVILTILGFVSLFLLLTKGTTMFAVIVKPLLLVLRRPRSWFVSLSSHISRITSTGEIGTADEVARPPPPVMSAKEKVVKKWGTD